MIKVKICGLRTPNVVAFAADAGADWIGFVGVENSPRYVRPENLPALVAACGQARPVALIDRWTDAVLIPIVEAGIDIVQLHLSQKFEQQSEALSSEAIARIKRRFGLEVWLGQIVHSVEDIEAAEMREGIDAFVFDTPAPTGSDQIGGHGIAFDWSLVRQAKQKPKNWLLAGGLTPENVADAIAQTACMAVDVSSGVERVRGEKDNSKISAFIRAAKACSGAVL